MLADLTTIFYWWALLFGLGIVFLPLTRRLFAKFFDQGYAFSKILALLLISYPVWLLGSLRALPFFPETIWLIILGWLVFNYCKLKMAKPKQSLLNIWALEEVLFLIGLIVWSIIRGFQPDIHGLEKFMDYGFVNSILRSRFFPPQDIWLAGKTINYYYFGHLVAAVLTKLSNINSSVTYNLMIATIFGFSLSAGFSLAANLIKSIIHDSKFIILGGLISALLLSLGGNLHLLWYVLANKTFAGYWYPDATRFIVEKFGAADNTIHEFPIYSFVVADLHGHLSNFPFVLLFLSLILIVFIQKQISLLHRLIISLLLAVFYMTNAWDVPIYGLILGIALLLSFKNLWKTIKFGIWHLALSILFSLPFHLRFQSLAKGVSLVDFHSPLWMLGILWGWPLFLTLIFITFILKRKKQKTDCFILVLFFVSWLLILIPEIIYVKDIYIHSYQRANTLFKLTYQAFVMFSLASGYVFIRLLTGIKNKVVRNSFVIVYLSFVICLLAYSYFAIPSYYGVNDLKSYKGLNGLQYLQNLYPDDYKAILWLQKNIKGQPIILEAVGESYTDFARVSANTGLLTIIGWPVHEWLWRGSYDEPGKRREEVRKIYEDNNFQETKNLLQQYQVNYIFLGALEKQQYKNLNQEKFDQLGKVVYQSGNTKIYRLEVSNSSMY